MAVNRLTNDPGTKLLRTVTLNFGTIVEIRETSSA
jgi:hypothetical protein